MIARAAILLVFLSATAATHAHEPNWCGLPRPHPLDAAHAQAMANSGGVTVEMRDAQARAYAGWDAELNRLYRGALRHFGQDVRAVALRAAQRAWLEWDRAETLSDLAQQAESGTAGPLIVSDLALQRLRARACTLDAMQADAEASN